MSIQTNSSIKTTSEGEALEVPKRSRKLAFFLLVFVLSGLFFLAGRFVFTPFFLQVPGDFSYSADVLSLDNFYDEEEGKFRGEERSVTTFVFAFEGAKQGTALIKNIFDVRTVTGDQIVSIERQYGVDRRTWKHDPNMGDREREGYLFAPRYLKVGDSFTYWHVNYDTPIGMVFDGIEVIDGVRTYRFTSEFGVDQTDNLTHLQGVPEERGINLDVGIKLWIEPVSGWLVKYRDEAIAYYYDQETGKRLHPWNTFTNSYAKSSVQEKAQTAAKLKRQIEFIQFGVPILILLLGILILLFVYVDSKKKKIGGIAALILSIIFTILFFSGFLSPSQESDEQVVIGISRFVPLGNPIYDENIRGFKDALAESGFREGKDLIFIDRTADARSDRQEEVAREFIKEDVDLIFSLTTPGTLSLKDKISNRPIVFSVVTYPVETGVIEALDNSGNNLVGTRNWVPIKEQISVFREIAPSITSIGFIHRTNEPNSTIQLAEMREAVEQLDIEVVEIDGIDLPELMIDLEEKGTTVDSLYSSCDTLVLGEAEELIIEFAKDNQIPSFSCNTSGPLKGDLVGVVADFYQIGRLAGEKASLILEGASPSSLDTSTVTRPFIYINQTTADFLGITIPQSILIKVREIFK